MNYLYLWSLASFSKLYRERNITELKIPANSFCYSCVPFYWYFMWLVLLSPTPTWPDLFCSVSFVTYFSLIYCNMLYCVFVYIGKLSKNFNCKTWILNFGQPSWPVGIRILTMMHFTFTVLLLRVGISGHLMIWFHSYSWCNENNKWCIRIFDFYTWKQSVFAIIHN